MKEYKCEEWTRIFFTHEVIPCNRNAKFTFKINPPKEDNDGTRNVCALCAPNLESWGFPKTERVH